MVWRVALAPRESASNTVPDCVATREIVCLANSRKWSGRCVAGKEIANGRPGEWIRPVSERKTGELSHGDMCFRTGGIPKLLDIIAVPLRKPLPRAYQRENHLIASDSNWIRRGELPPQRLAAFCDHVPALWLNGCHSAYGFNDRVPQRTAEKELSSSLCLIRPDALSIEVNQQLSKMKIRARLMFRGVQYRLMVTDPDTESDYSMRANGVYPIAGNEIYLCVSLGEPYSAYCYKLVASILDASRIQGS